MSAPVPSDEWPVEARPGIVAVALKSLCPRCGHRTLYAGYIRFADACAHCGLDFTRFDVGDGPAAFLTLILGTLVVVMAIVLELSIHPPLWLHMLIWVPVTLVGVVLCLRVAKSALIALEYRTGAREGRTG